MLLLSSCSHIGATKAEKLEETKYGVSYIRLSMLFLFPVKDGKLSTCVNATFDASCYG